MTIDLPESVQWILSKLNECGYKAHVVGGCVRDAIMGVEPHDWDICSSALPEETMKCFSGEHIVETGLQHGTITLMLDHEPYEITSYRVDGKYDDNRRPSSVTFTNDLVQDLARRDFTMNAIAYSPLTGIIDPFSGTGDISNKLIRCVGKASDRFNEDALRIMRALRFSSVLVFQIDDEASTAIMNHRELLKNIAIERVNTEFCNLLLGENVGAILNEYHDVIGTFIPEIKQMYGFSQNNPYHIYDVWKHTTKSIACADKSILVRLTMFFHDIAKPQCHSIGDDGVGHFYEHPKHSAEVATTVMERMKFDNKTIETVRELVFYHDAELHTSAKVARRWLNRLGNDRLRLLLKVKRADVLAQAEWCQADRLQQLDRFEMLVDDVLTAEDCFSLKDLAVNGKDIMRAGIPGGPEVGAILNELLTKVMDEELNNDRDILLSNIKKVRGKQQR